jgi:50S ribosomal protein L16 3-hydroxylase
MRIEDVFGTFCVCEFIQTHLHRLPIALAGSAKAVCALGSWEVLRTILAEPQSDVLIIRRGENLSGRHAVNFNQWRDIISQGYTLRIRHAERHHPDIGSLAQEFERTFESPVDIHLYVTPADTFGFSWHYDAEDVFIVQTAGEKEYFLRKNTVNPWPLGETMPEDMRYQRELMPLMRATLRAGDLLYIPCGYWHRAQTSLGSDVAISLAIGIMSRSAMHIFDLLRPKLLESLLWRQRLPVSWSHPEEDVKASYERLLRELANDIAKELTNPAFVSHLVVSGRPACEPAHETRPIQDNSKAKCQGSVE